MGLCEQVLSITPQAQLWLAQLSLVLLARVSRNGLGDHVLLGGRSPALSCQQLLTSLCFGASRALTLWVPGGCALA